VEDVVWRISGAEDTIHLENPGPDIVRRQGSHVGETETRNGMKRKKPEMEVSWSNVNMFTSVIRQPSADYERVAKRARSEWLLVR
jgi:hypothetical protein